MLNMVIVISSTSTVNVVNHLVCGTSTLFHDDALHEASATDTQTARLRPTSRGRRDNNNQRKPSPPINQLI